MSKKIVDAYIASLVLPFHGALPKALAIVHGRISAMGKQQPARILIAAIASAVTSGVFQIAVAIGDGWLRKNAPPYMPLAWGLVAILWIWWGLVKLKDVRSKEKPEIPNAQESIHAEAKIGGDYAPKYGEFAPQANPIIAPVFNFPQAPVAMPPPLEPNNQKSESPSATSRIPHLFVEFARNNVAMHRDFFEFDSKGEMGFLLAVRNLPASQGEFGLGARSITATIRISSPPSSATAKAAFWVGHSGNQITLEPGDDAYILVGIPNDFGLHLFNNPNSYSYEMVEWNYPREEPVHMQLFVTNGKAIVVELDVISRDVSSRNLTLYKGRFILSPSNGINSGVASYRCTRRLE